VLADAVMDEPAGRVGRRERRHALRPCVVGNPWRSADPPTISGTAAVSASRADSEATRVAISLGVAASFSLTPRTAAASASFGRSPEIRRSNSARRSGATLAAAAPRPAFVFRARPPAARQAAPMSAGTSNGGEVQPSRLRAPLISSPERRAVGLFAARLAGRPKPMTVRQAIRLGRSDDCATAIAAAIASGSWPSTRQRSSRRP